MPSKWSGPLSNSGYSIAHLLKQPEHGVGFTERRDSFELYRIPYYEDIEGVAPCGAIVSNIEVKALKQKDPAGEYTFPRK